jgi:adenylate cyclase, class 2
MPPQPSQNLELKTRYEALDRARAKVKELGAKFDGIQVQTDTFFQSPKGRLKLREIDCDAPVLIWYSRPDEIVGRTSSYYLVPVADPALLKVALKEAMTIRCVVHKRREIYLWHNVRIHLDEVTGLGKFVEFEAVISADHGPKVSQAWLTILCEELEILPTDQLAPSYADLLETGQRN